MMTESDAWKWLAEEEAEREAEEGDFSPAERDDGRGWARQVDAAVAKAREDKEAAAVGAGLGRAFDRTLTTPSLVAEEMRRRSNYLRSRPMRGYRQSELEMLRELDGIEAEARALDERRQQAGEEVLAEELADLGCSVFAVRGRYADLLRMIGEPFPSRAAPEKPEDRRRELSAIEAFLARKRARASDPSTPEGK